MFFFLVSAFFNALASCSYLEGKPSLIMPGERDQETKHCAFAGVKKNNKCECVQKLERFMQYKHSIFDWEFADWDLHGCQSGFSELERANPVLMSKKQNRREGSYLSSWTEEINVSCWCLALSIKREPLT